LTACRRCDGEYEGLSRLWNKLGMLPDAEPGRGMRARFYSMLDGYRDGIEISRHQRRPGWGLEPWLSGLLGGSPVFQFALAALILVAGVLIGRMLVAPAPGNPELADLRAEVNGMRQMVTLSLLQQQSASERLAGVSWSQRVGRPDERVLTALVQALNSDPSVDVRLAAVDALFRYSSRNEVRQALVQSLSRQTSPLVQIALIDLMVELGEKQSSEVLRRMATDADLNEAVRQRARWGLQQLS
jgi:HEAT repeat protein